MSFVSRETTPSRLPVGPDALPGPRTLNPLGNAIPFQRDPLGFIKGLHEQYGDVVRFRILNRPFLLINQPDYLKRVLLDNNANYNKDVPNLVRMLLGNGLATMTGSQWLVERRLMQPAFHHQRVAAFGTLMTNAILEMLQRWEMFAAEGQTFDVVEEMAQLILCIVGQAFFSSDVSAKSNAFTEIRKNLAAYVRFPFPPLIFPTPSHRRLWKAIRTIDEVTTDIINQRYQSKEEKNDLLAMLLGAVDKETGAGMSHQQLLDEAKTILFTGQETSTNALTWIWNMLSQYPDVEQQLHTELDQVLSGRIPTVEDLPRLRYTRMVVDETLRLHAVVWQLMRRSREEDRLGPYTIPAKTTIFFSPYLFHRHTDFWHKPTAFHPDHFLPEQVAKRPRHAYMPFGYGPHQC